MNHDAMDIVIPTLLDVADINEWGYSHNPDGSYTVSVPSLHQTYEFNTWIDHAGYMHISANIPLKLMARGHCQLERKRLQVFTLINNINTIDGMWGAFVLDEHNACIQWNTSQLMPETDEEVDATILGALFYDAAKVVDAYLCAFLDVNENSADPEVAMMNSTKSLDISHTQH